MDMKTAAPMAWRRDLDTWLRSDQNAHRLAEALFDFAMAQPLHRYVTPERVLGWIDAALTADAVEHFAREHLAAALAREQEHARRREDDRLADALPDTTRSLLEEIAARPVRLSRAAVERWVRQDAVAHLLRAVVQASLDRFISLLRPGAHGGLIGQVARGPGAAMLGRVLDQMESPLKRAASRFVSSSVDVLVGPVATLFAGEQTSRRLGELRLEALRAILGVQTRQVLDDLAQLPVARLAEEIPRVLAHNLARPEIREAVLDHLQAVLAAEGGRPVADLLGAAAVATYRQQVGELGGALLRDFFSDDSLLQWLDLPAP